MLRIGFALLGLLVSSLCFATQSASMSLLDNRFRVDPSIEQITFVIYRAENSVPVVLVRPDGRKYYSHRHPDNVRWYQESAMDIISIEKPMPGPWQAVGKVTPKNKIKLISHLKLSSDVLPERLFQDEQIKFTARLTSDDKPLLLRDFLDRVKLKVTFTKFVENEESLIKEARPVPIEIGEFADDGIDLDEKAGDGVFTVKLPITPAPGKYRVRITSGNGVFLRAQEQEVLVYPNPITLTFIQSRQEQQSHQVIFTGEQGMIEPGSLAAHIEHTDAQGVTIAVEGAAASAESMNVELAIPYSGVIGEYSWQGEAYATELGSGRELMFPLSEHTYSVVKDIDLAETRRLQEQEREKQAKLLAEKRIAEAREAQRKKSMLIIAIGNVVVVILGLVIWFVMRKLKAKRAAIPEMQLEMPKK
ncbi:TIGR03503 family protein [Vibrio panuliri]|uniref:TIGR03503 family protein n=1 Tax=Vibrio panuliri TaxID=1381081 RepID=A0A1Q9HLX0_9VIBR|nr:TIGR03503 family protein [Vibrio panuliri]KAB1453651.1 TIGR03503 family protein [Vibrio panuliri]OLQ91581.1 TIGR03503 family protein [Vibrio panuliri]OLQ96155.1 TIGR03503 family protein [Vibrio panuliri]